MVNDYPDYGVYTGTTPVATIIDRAELAARLGSINVYDRRGFIVWMDDFEAPLLKWNASIVAGGTLPVLSTTMSWSGNQSAYLHCPAVAGTGSRLWRRFPLLRQGRFGAEFWIALSTLDPAYLNIIVDIFDGATPSRVELEIRQNERTITLVHETGQVVVADDVWVAFGYSRFVPIKIVADMDTDYYVRLMYGEREIDVSQYQLDLRPAAGDKYIDVLVTLFGRAAGVSQAYFDGFILTQTEP